MVISIDFDGTCVTHDFPFVGRDIGSVPVLKELVSSGNLLILFTMRSDTTKGDFLKNAVSWFEENEIPLYGVQTNPSQTTWTTSPKAYAEMYIDDAALGCPLIYPGNGERPYVDWIKVREILIDMDIIKKDGDSQIS
jgi:hypothetical protein